MSVPIGSLIKLKRIELGMSQEDLASGICASSYLSRIENNKLIPDEEIYHLLLDRLGLDYDEIASDVDTVDEEIEEWYQELLSFRSCREKKKERDIEELHKRADVAGTETGFKFRAVYARYLLKEGRIEEAVRCLEQLKQVIPQKANRAFFIYTNVMLFSFILRRDYKSAIECGLELSSVKGFNELGSQEEIGIFLYNIALSYLYLNRYKKAEDYAKKALNLFNNGYHLERSYNTLIILGACKTNLNQFTSALETYDLAEKALNYLPGDEWSFALSEIDNNRGVCKVMEGSFVEAIYYFKRALDNVPEDQKIVPMINLVYSCYVADKIEEAKSWMNKIKGIAIEQLPELYKIQIEILSVLLDGDEQDIKEVERVQKKSFDFFLKHNHLQLALRYSNLFITVYEKRHFYKKANELYKIIQATQREMIEGGW